MSTDLYGVRVLAVDPDRCEARLRVFVVYYDTAVHGYAPPETDPGFLFALLWQAGRWDSPIGHAVTVDQVLDEAWMAEHARWFVAGVEQVAARNLPPAEDDWAHLHDFYYERDGRWRDEDRLVQADFLVRVTHARWIEHLEPGMAWGSTHYPLGADCPRAEDLPHVPDLRHPAALLSPFDDKPDELAFSDDGRYLAAAYEGELAIYDTRDWSEHARVALDPGNFGARLMWAPDRHVVTLLHREGGPQHAYDVDARTALDVPVEAGHARSRTGRHRVEYGVGKGIRFVGAFRDDVHLDGCAYVDTVAFTADESRLFAAGMRNGVSVLDPSAGVVLDTVDAGVHRMRSLAVSPDGAYLAVAGRTSEYVESDELRVLRLGDRQVVTRYELGKEVRPLAWSPDGRWLAAAVGGESGGGLRVMPVGLPAEPPAALRQAPAATDTMPETPSLDPDLILALAQAADPVTQGELDALARDHRRWLASGGGGAAGAGPAWQVLAVSGLPLAVYRGRNGSQGDQASLRNRVLDPGLDLHALVLPWADLTAVVGEKLDLAGADLRGSTVTDARLPHARLHGADLRQADFSRSDLRGADLSGADLREADFEHADLSGADLTGALLEGAKGLRPLS
ncbi:pentapeptide repeat-containing protein [Nonomuraea sp. NPDC000554]|uniref:pentapeptide repeat-containing protein n=1 Tax=Nonomuraea sp. NPDC000554 TaxID=3154259 RepID=UPI003331B510